MREGRESQYSLTTYIDNKPIRTAYYNDLEEAQLDYEYFMLNAQGLQYVRYEIGGSVDV